MEPRAGTPGIMMAVALVTMSSAAWASGVDRALDARIESLLDGYVLPDGTMPTPPTVEVASLGRTAVAASNCNLWRIQIQPRAIETLSDAALDDILAHELAHLLVCAETGQNRGHSRDWWNRYQSLVGLT